MLTDRALRALRPRGKPYKVADERGLFVLVTPSGGVLWRLKYRFGGREKLLALGKYPDTSLKDARDKRDEARALLAKRVDPGAVRQEQRQSSSNTFEAIAREWLSKQHAHKRDTIGQLRRRLETYVFPFLGSHPIAAIRAGDLLRVLRKIEARGTLETAHRVRSLCGQVFRYAVTTGRADRNIAADLIGALAPVKGRNFAAITDPKRIGELLRAIDGYEGQPTVLAALRLAPYVFVRPGELRAAEWSEFDLDAAEWRIQGERTKMGTPHVVPLSRQALGILRELEAHAGHGKLLFPSLRSVLRPISDNTLNAALRRLGYRGDEQTTHGFRSLASTRLNELGYPPDVIELQLAHIERNKVRSAYNKAERLPERRKMMQEWADYLDALRTDTRARVRRTV